VRFLDFKQHFKAFRVFSVADILKWDRRFDTRRLVEWQQKSYVRRIVNRWYMFADEAVDERFLYLVSNRIYSPSYISCESAFGFYHLIPEGVYSITSVTTLKTDQVTNFLGNFNYRHMKPDLFFGYRLIEAYGHHVRMAEPEKLILDFLYLNPKLQNADDFESLRIDAIGFHDLVRGQKLQEYLSLFRNKALEKRVRTFLNIFAHA
jgi:predicted transcriptional regulator of viral defense system